MTAHDIWVIDDDQSIRWVLDKTLTGLNYSVKCFASADEAIDAIRQEQPRCIITDIRMPGISGLELLSMFTSSVPDIPIVVMTAHSDLDSAVQAYDGGAFEYLPKPFDIDEVSSIVERAISVNNDRSSEPPSTTTAIGNQIIGESPAMQEVFRAIGRLSKSNISVLVTGPSGSGKERIAEALHQNSPRKGAPFIALNMAAIPKDLIESELFGHAKGAFTGASKQRTGRFEQAEGGTLFLDEIGDMPAEAQTRLLRVLAENKFYPVGATEAITSNVRIVAATHQDLERLVEQGKFREDLFHRLNVIRIQVPSLSERPEDIIKLAEHFLAQAAAEMEVPKKVLSDEAKQKLKSLSWPGNVRQLENCCRWMTVMAPGSEVEAVDFPPELMGSKDRSGTPSTWQQSLTNYARQAIRDKSPNLLSQVQHTVERILINEALQATGGRKAEAAQLLGCGRNTLTRKLKELDLS